MSYYVRAIVQVAGLQARWLTVLDLGIYTREMVEFLTPEPHYSDDELKLLGGNDFLDRVDVAENRGSHIFTKNEWQEAYRLFCKKRFFWNKPPLELQVIDYMMDQGMTRLIAFKDM